MLNYRYQLLFIFATIFAADGVYAYQELPDPTRPSAGVILPDVKTTEKKTEAKKKTAFELNAIMERSGNFIAIINKKRVKEGERVDGAKVVAIAKRKVTLLTSGKLVVLKLASFGFKTKAN